MPKYLVTLESGREFIMESPYYKDDADQAEDLAYEVLEEASYMDDYLVDVRLVDG